MVLITRNSWIVLGLGYLLGARGHIALWDEGMYGYDYNDPNQSEPVLPLYDLPFNEWWFHGYIDRPPRPGKMMNLPSGGTYHGQVACNKALTTLGANPSQQTGLYACEGDGPTGGTGAMHTTDRWMAPLSEVKDVMGCSISIAYKSDPKALVPEDFTVISTNYTCPWYKHVDFQIPSDLPPCPPGGCHCMWGWVHSIYAGSEQNYVLNYRCNVTGATGARPLPAPKTANKCQYPTDTGNCTVGAKQPHYWLQKERNNNFQGYYDPPHNGQYGFINGAQTDLFAGVAALPSANAPSPSSVQQAATSPVVQQQQPSPVAPSPSSASTAASLSQTTSVRPTASPSLPIAKALRCDPKRVRRQLSPKEQERMTRINERRRERLRRRSLDVNAHSGL